MTKVLTDERFHNGLWVDHRSLFQTAAVLAITNKGRTSAEHIIDTIRANIREGESTYVSTCGWVAYSWQYEDGSTHVKVAVEPYTVQKYLDSLK